MSIVHRYCPYILLKPQTSELGSSGSLYVHFSSPVLAGAIIQAIPRSRSRTPCRVGGDQEPADQVPCFEGAPFTPRRIGGDQEPADQGPSVAGTPPDQEGHWIVRCPQGCKVPREYGDKYCTACGHRLKNFRCGGINE